MRIISQCDKCPSIMAKRMELRIVMSQMATVATELLGLSQFTPQMRNLMKKVLFRVPGWSPIMCHLATDFSMLRARNTLTYPG